MGGCAPGVSAALAGPILPGVGVVMQPVAAVVHTGLAAVALEQVPFTKAHTADTHRLIRFHRRATYKRGDESALARSVGDVPNIVRRDTFLPGENGEKSVTQHKKQRILELTMTVTAVTCARNELIPPLQRAKTRSLTLCGNTTGARASKGVALQTIAIVDLKQGLPSRPSPATQIFKVNVVQ